ncbi:hypothetical protein H0I76_19020 [Limibaculum sp. M0105]|uniref:Uncharacterized protein n=1 Tax=Thermohalobaculum xanthum TaxID=2753746 RepID=A0A8J7MBF1_9RHOB|nr:hypothetical protein [Thermohalobaculum xanthum]MBK0401295.1 hypothetical protein [Thermohalobaculum xanthum]
MTPFIDLGRRFRDLTPKELEDSDLLASLREHDLGPDVGWADLLRHSRVVLLAEAGAGKTREMVEQAKRLSREGRFAFFVALESLDRDPLHDLLSTTDEARFEAWRADGDAPAWFFLDAVDELKLTEGKLDRALLRLSKSISAHLGRARVVISCRPTDWRANLDLAIVEERLPVPERSAGASSQTAEDAFIETLRRDRGEAASQGDADEPEASSAIRTVTMLPMSDRQIRLYSEQSGVHDATAFLSEVSRQNAWTFARRPLDLGELIETWRSSGRLGTRAQQHEANVTAKLKDDPARRDRGVLTDAQAQVGAERLALALALTRTRILRTPDQPIDRSRDEGVLDPAANLRDWTEDERQALLRRALFDPATYGRVRFHHRSVQEYLAAQRLKTLREKGMSTKALFRLLFAERYGVKVVFPSMRAIAAWLALWDDSVRQELTRREPEALLSLGDPESLSISARAQLLNAFVDAYGEGGWRGLDLPVDEIRRLSHPELAPNVRKLWGDGPINSDVRGLLIEVIRQGPIESCADLAHSAALNVDWDDYHRIAAVRALIACGKEQIVREIAEDVLARPESWPDRVVHGLATKLFPAFVDVDELIELMERSREPKRTIGGFAWATREIVEALDQSSALAGKLRDRMADLIWRGRRAIPQNDCIRSKFDHLAAALAKLCERQLGATTTSVDPALIRACVIASRFGGDETGRREPIGKLRAHTESKAELRSAAFWAELAFMDEIRPTRDDWHRYFNAENESLIGHLTENDRLWLEAAVVDDTKPERRTVALHALIQLWHQRGRVAAERDALRALVNGDAILEELLKTRTSPPPRNMQSEALKRKSDKEKRKRAAREAQRLKDWQIWRQKLLADPAEAFSPAKQSTTIANLYSWLRSRGGSGGRYDVWDKAALLQAFGSEVAERAEEAFKSHWRTVTPQLPSARPEEERNTTPYSWIYGLCGVSAEADTPSWAVALSHCEARLASAYATLELNGFASFVYDLVAAHPVAVDEVIGGELTVEITSGGDPTTLPMLQDLAYAEEALKRLLLPRLLAVLRAWPSRFSEESGPRWAHHLEHVLRILGEVAGETNRQCVAQECETRYAAEPTGPLALVWLRGLFRLDAERGTEVVAQSLASDNHPEVRARAIATFAGLFGEREAVLFEIKDPGKRARALGNLVRSAYAFIRREDDHTHEGMYSPDTRDQAETARNFLLSTLLDTPGPEARRVVLELAAEPDFAHFPDRLRLLARQRTALDAEFPPYEATAIADLDSRYELPPHDRDGLFTVMLDRLEDLAHDLAHYDFTDRRTLRSITDEAEMQRTLAWRLDARSNAAYTVTREDEVAEQKRTDIRLSAVRGDQKAVIEVKIADARWSVSDLERALRNQLVGQYLRHELCKAGCLLLTYDGKKKYWINKDTRKRIRFAELIGYLSEQAKAIEAEQCSELRLSVFGLDLTDPHLPAAHR